MRKLFIALLLVFFVFVSLNFTQDNVKSRIEKIENALLPPIPIKNKFKWNIYERMKYHKVFGVSVAVINNFHVEWAKGYGVLDTKTNNPVTETTLFQAASISKPVAAMAVLRKVQEGKLSLYEDINNKLVSWKLPGNKFTEKKKVLLKKEALLKYFKAVTGRELSPGVIAVIQSFGSRINLHPHLHFLVSEGGSDGEGRFHSVSRFNEDLLREIFTREVFSLLVRKQLINLTLVQKILRWRHTGFHVHSKVRATSKQEAERVGKYMIRPILSLKRLSFDEAQGQVIYQYGKHSSKLERMDYLEFIARVTSHIPDKGQVMVRYYGLYSNVHRGKMRKAEVSPSYPPIIEEEERFVPSKGWAEMIKKVYEVDPLLCPECGGQMSIISFIEEHKVIDKIINHLKLTFHAERPPPPQVVQQELMMAAEEGDKYF